MKKIVAIICTNGRFTLLQRCLSCFINQDYPNKHLIIFNNAKVPIELSPINNVTLINNHTDYLTGLDYSNVGDIFRDALTHIPADSDFVSIMDDDDIYLPHHFSSAILRFNQNLEILVWKNGNYFYKDGEGISLNQMDNNLEGSCIIDYKFLHNEGFHSDSLTYHLKWLYKAESLKKVFVDHGAKPSFCYDVSQPNIVHLGGFSAHFGNNQKLLEEHLQKYNDYGETPLRPWDSNITKKYFDLFFDLDDYV